MSPEKKLGKVSKFLLVSTHAPGVKLRSVQIQKLSFFITEDEAMRSKRCRVQKILEKLHAQKSISFSTFFARAAMPRFPSLEGSRKLIAISTRVEEERKKQSKKNATTHCCSHVT